MLKKKVTRKMSNWFTQFMEAPISLPFLILIMTFTAILDIILIIISNPDSWNANSTSGAKGKFLFTFAFVMIWLNFYYFLKILQQIRQGSKGLDAKTASSAGAIPAPNSTSTFDFGSVMDSQPPGAGLIAYT